MKSLKQSREKLGGNNYLDENCQIRQKKKTETANKFSTLLM